jgi:hypothetical protein
VALHGAPGTLRVIDAKTVYLRMPATFMESEALLMTLKNLMRQAYDKEQRGEVAPAAGKAPEPKKAAKPQAAKQREPEPTLPHPQIENLKKLRDQGILTEEQFQEASRKVLAKT